MLQDVPPTSRSRVKISLEETSHGFKAIKAIGFFSVHYEIVESNVQQLKKTLITQHKPFQYRTMKLQTHNRMYTKVPNVGRNHTNTT